MCWEAATRNLALGLLFEASVLLGACSHSVRTPAKKEKRAHARSTQNMSCRSPLCRVFGINTTLCLYKPEKRQSLSLSRPLIKRRDFSPLSLLATAQWRAGDGTPARLLTGKAGASASKKPSHPDWTRLESCTARSGCS